MGDKIIIFGAGEWGKNAYMYYKDKCEVLCFIDNSKELQGKYLIEEQKIYEPDILKAMDCSHIKVVIASKWNKEQMKEQLYREFGISTSIIFEIRDSVEEYFFPESMGSSEDEIIIEYEGGLGNQMFQYAFAKCFMLQGYKVTGYVSSYHNIGRRKFILNQVFPGISIFKCNNVVKENYKRSKEYLIEEVNMNSVTEYKADMQVLKCKKGYFRGYWQSVKYVDLVKEELKKEFCFIHKKDMGLVKFQKKIQMENSVSVHIRRSDYLSPKSIQVLGNICTIDYYKKAISLMREKVFNPIFYFFSDDIEWVKVNLPYMEAIYVTSDCFESYEDWYDMYLISNCKHNIIANSTFGWWGAWLNSYEGKIIIAPEKWSNTCDFKDIYPSDFILI